jgi:hypothetical protein
LRFDGLNRCFVLASEIVVVVVTNAATSILLLFILFTVILTTVFVFLFAAEYRLSIDCKTNIVCRFFRLFCLLRLFRQLCI